MYHYFAVFSVFSFSLSLPFYHFFVDSIEISSQIVILCALCTTVRCINDTVTFFFILYVNVNSIKARCVAFGVSINIVATNYWWEWKK